MPNKADMRLRELAAWVVTVGTLFLASAPVRAQSLPIWNRVAGTTVNKGLAAPATGPVRSVWYSPSGDRLLVQTESGRIFETLDFQHWQLNVSQSDAAVPAETAAIAGPRRYAVRGNNVFGSDDGRTWLNLTGFNNKSILGEGFSSLAVSPSNPLDLTVGNQTGVWRSLDGGLSWRGLNEDLPNLQGRRLASQRMIVLADGTLAADVAGKWTLENAASPDSAPINLALRAGHHAVAAAQSGPMIYIANADGEIFISDDGGGRWTDSPVTGSSDAVTRIWADPNNGQTALVAAGASLFRTTNGGKWWDEITGALNAGQIHGITADSGAGVVYAATDNGVFSGRISLSAADQAVAVWSSISRDLPFAAAWDVRLNPDGSLTVLLDGYGVYETVAPHRSQAPRIVNGADLSDRAAAPGSLISVLGANVKQARTGVTAYKVLSFSDQNSQLQVPFEITPGNLQLVLEGDGGRWVAPLNVKDAAPAVFVDADGAPMIQDAESGLVIDAGTPVRAGTVIQVLATGLGRVTPEWPTGMPAPVDSPPTVRAAVTAFLDGKPIQVTRATLAPTFVGYYLVELQIPLIVNRGANELRIVVNGEESNRVKLYLESNLATR
jgi:uncharacterized protein (TIGR03437 family)